MEPSCGNEKPSNVRLLETERLVASLDKFILDAWVKWVTTKHNSKAPPWLMKAHLGSITTSGGEMESIVIRPLYQVGRPEVTGYETAKFVNNILSRNKVDALPVDLEFMCSQSRLFSTTWRYYKTTRDEIEAA